MRNVMIDLETLSTRPDAALLSIGAVRFDETGVASTEEHGHDWQMYAVLEAPTGHVDVDTVRWWLQQSEPARAAVATEIAHFWPERQVLQDFKDFFERVPESLLWCWPSVADEVWLRSCYLRNGYGERGAAANRTLPWTHRQVRCARTVAQLLCLGKAPCSDEHNALADARAQAEQTSLALRKFRYLARYNPDGEFDELAEVA
jgi:hypothetical protein